MNYYDTRAIKPYRDHTNSPIITLYVIDDNADTTEKFSCLYCKRTFTEIKATVRTIISTPTPVIDFGIALTVRCKLCHQNYRFVANARLQLG